MPASTPSSRNWSRRQSEELVGSPFNKSLEEEFPYGRERYSGDRPARRNASRGVTSRDNTPRGAHSRDNTQRSAGSGRHAPFTPNQPARRQTGSRASSPAQGDARYNYDFSHDSQDAGSCWRTPAIMVSEHDAPDKRDRRPREWVDPNNGCDPRNVWSPDDEYDYPADKQQATLLQNSSSESAGATVVEMQSMKSIFMKSNVPGFEAIDDVTKLRHAGLATIINDASDEELLELLHVGASRSRFWPLQLPTLAPLARALRAFAASKEAVAQKATAQPAKRKNGSGSSVGLQPLRSIRGLTFPNGVSSRASSGDRSARSGATSGGRSTAEAARSWPPPTQSKTDGNFSAPSSPGIPSQPGSPGLAPSNQGELLHDIIAANNVADFGKAKSNSTVPRSSVNVSVIHSKSQTRDAQNGYYSSVDYPGAATTLLDSSCGKVLETTADGFKNGDNLIIDYPNENVRMAFDGFEEDLATMEVKEQTSVVSSVSHFWQKLLFHLAVIGVSVFYGLQQGDTFSGDLDFVSRNCEVPLIFAKGTALGTCIWTTVLFLTMNRRLMSLIGSIGPTRGRWCSWAFDGARNFHMHAGHMLILNAIIHTLGHVVCTLPMMMDETPENLNMLVKCDTPNNENYLVKGLPFDGPLVYPKCPFTRAMNGLEVWASTPGITGLIMLFTLIMLGYTCRKTVRKRNYELFAYFHAYVIFIWPILLFLHGINQWIGLGIPLVFFCVVYPWVSYLLLDVCPRVLHMTSWRKLAVNCAVVHLGSDPNDPAKEATVSLFFKRNWKFGCLRGGWRPGQIAFLRVPSISRWQWHPFTIASGSDGQLRFCIKDCGDWTKALINQILASENPTRMSTKSFGEDHAHRILNRKDLATVSEGDRTDNPVCDLFYSALGARLDSLNASGVLDQSLAVRFPSMEMSIDGPYRAPTITALDHVFNTKTGGIVCFVASGIGITPFIAVIDSIIDDLLADQPRSIHPDTQIHLYWMTKKVDDFLLALPAFRKIHDNPILQDRIFLHLHLTSLERNVDLSSNAVYLFRWGIHLHNQLLRLRLDRDQSPVPMVWLYKKPKDILGLRYLAEEVQDSESTTKSTKNSSIFSAVSEKSLFRGSEDAEVMHSVVLGRPDFGFEINMMGALNPEMPIHVFMCANASVESILNRVVQVCNRREGGRKRFFLKSERFES